MMLRAGAVSCLVFTLAAGSASAQGVLLIPDSTNNRVMAFSPFDGSIINLNFITVQAGDPFAFTTPVEAVQVGNQIWVSDQVQDRVHRFDLSGAFQSTIGNAGLDNIRGMGVINNSVYLANAGTQNGAPGNALLQFDFNGNLVGTIPMNGSSWDIVSSPAGDLLVTDSTSNNIERYLPDGTALGAFENPASPINFPQQMAYRANGNLLAAGFSGSTNAGLYEFDPAGNQVGYYLSPFGVRGTYELGNGRILATYGSGAGARIVSLDPLTGTTIEIIAGGITPRFINYVEIPAPGASALFVAFGALGIRRRRA